MFRNLHPIINKFMVYIHFIDQSLKFVSSQIHQCTDLLFTSLEIFNAKCINCHLWDTQIEAPLKYLKDKPFIFLNTQAHFPSLRAVLKYNPCIQSLVQADAILGKKIINDNKPLTSPKAYQSLWSDQQLFFHCVSQRTDDYHPL